MEKERSETISEIRDYFYEDNHHSWTEDSLDKKYAQARVSPDNFIALLQDTPADIEWDSEGIITLVPQRHLGFKFELQFVLYHWHVNSILHIDELCWENYGGYKEAFNRFRYLIDRNYDIENVENLEITFHNLVWNEDIWDERFLIEQILRSKGTEDDLIIEAGYNLIFTKLSGSSWLSICLEEDEIRITPDPGFGSPVTLCYDTEIFRMQVDGDEIEKHQEYWIEKACNKLLTLIGAEISNDIVHRQSIYLKNESETTSALMDKLLDKRFRDSDEECFIDILLRERKVQDQWFNKLSPEHEGSFITRYREKVRGNLFDLMYLEGIPFVILAIGFIGSIVIFIMFIFGKYEPITTYWKTIGPILSISHLIAVGIVAFYCFDDMTHDMRYDDIGPVSHQIGWLVIATTCFPIGYPIGLIAKIISSKLTNRFESDLEGRSHERIIYTLKDLTGLIPVGRIWIPSILFGIAGTVYWYKLPYIYKWILT